MLPKDDDMLLSFVNMKLRDGQISLDELCDEYGEARDEVEKRLLAQGYVYDAERNRFRPL